ncbi:multiple sugar transport system ATP-binding protein [Hephaestia caeni]|uniref:Multiple sugar transport system ATP-binding protein n=1 Tax=Hephaestia caeni TaxID=645617 RepID=A0A397P2S7_9SPHN|nr:sn-glycerol-3-phosphate ABC transporter ATP-binding protein UgpC [Hephaestia caeni]RIA43886.1 multiple sugar transport system ATP-binding protein [Hephaestia caeni]
MADVRLTGVRKAFGDTTVLDGVDLTVADGEFVVVVGPSGCGKSTLLRVIAGLEAPGAGSVAIGGAVVDHLPPAERGIAMVFQSYALYPHMSVRANLEFALRMQRLPRAEIRAAVDAAAATLDLTDLLDRRPAVLSGGQRQRVAIGRAIVRKPRVFLFDEPLSNLDAALRVRMRYEFAALHRALGATMLYVTHDQVEAMTLADRIVVLNQGRIEQVGTPQQLYDRPATRFVAGFIGTPRMNLIAATLREAGPDRSRFDLAGGAFLDGPPLAGIAPGAPVSIGIRPEHVAESGANAREGRVRFVESLGAIQVVHLDLPGLAEPLLVTTTDRPAPGATMSVALPPDRLHLFGGDGGALTIGNGAPTQKESWRQADNRLRSVS